VNWAAIGNIREIQDGYATVMHNSSGDGSDELQRHETLGVLASFYGPAAGAYCAMLSDGLQIAQNREVLRANAMNVLRTGDPVVVPELIKDLWVNRVDMMISLRREVRRTYPVLNVLSAQVVVQVPDPVH
jgi:hypothetical protein